jgi:pimeloyl-ACP methyl ester carboxylesterase
MTSAKVDYLSVQGSKIFYRSAGPQNGSVILLLHGFPSSSHQFRNLIPLLANEGYRVIAPDLPGYGFTEVPSDYKYTFENLSKTVESFIDALAIKKFSVYIFDYGAPTGLRLAIRRPEAVQSIITQNGNAYVEGLGDFWSGIKKYWASSSQEDRDALRELLTFESTKWQYEYGTPAEKGVTPPETYTLDYYLMLRPGNADIQLDLFKSYGSNVDLYPQFQEYFKKSQVPILGVWGKNDIIFIPPGLEAFKKDANVEINYLDAGHFAVESHTEEIAKLMIAFFKKNGI